MTCHLGLYILKIEESFKIIVATHIIHRAYQQIMDIYTGENKFPLSFNVILKKICKLIRSTSDKHASHFLRQFSVALLPRA